MAERPIFVPSDEADLVTEISLPLEWSSGFAVVQKQKNIAALHAAASQAGYAPVLEVSTKSHEKLGRHLSAFHLKVKTAQNAEIPLESAFQGSKVFQRGGPFTDLYGAEVRAAKRDTRLQASGRLTGFAFDGVLFPIEPRTAFYDWLYINAIYPHVAWLEARLPRYAAFSDIEFNPQRSINCQARSCALFVTLMRRGLLAAAVESPGGFLSLIGRYSYRPQHSQRVDQETLFPSHRGR